MIVFSKGQRFDTEADAIELTEEEARAIYEQLRARFKPSKKKGKQR